MQTKWYDRLLGSFAHALSRIRVWHRWPFLIAMPMIVGNRVNLRRNNLHDTETVRPKAPDPQDFDVRGQRTADGSYNDLSEPWMGMAGARFGRNMPLAKTFGETPPRLFDPSPRLVSRELLARREFVPVPH